MATNTILWVTAEDVSASNPVVVAFQDAGYELVSTASPSQAVAVLFLNRCVCAVVLDQRLKQTAGLAGTLHSIRADVPILLLSQDKVSPLPQSVDGCVCVGEGLEGLLPSLQTVLSTRHTAA